MVSPTLTEDDYDFGGHFQLVGIAEIPGAFHHLVTEHSGWQRSDGFVVIFVKAPTPATKSS